MSKGTCSNRASDAQSKTNWVTINEKNKLLYGGSAHDYEFRGMLGKGTFAVVHMAESKHCKDRRFAIKMVYILLREE